MALKKKHRLTTQLNPCARPKLDLAGLNIEQGGMDGMADIKSNTQEERQLVVFDLANESYGVDIHAVQGIIRMQAITKMPKTPDFVEGVINLRGKVIPIVDMRKRFDLVVKEETKDSRIVVVDIGGQEVGIIVDAVTEVLRITNDSIEPPSSVITSTDSAYLMGIAKVEDRLIILMDLENVLSHAEKGTITTTQTEMEESLPEHTATLVTPSQPETNTELVKPKKTTKSAALAGIKD